jgi:hypothetical protein
MGNRLIDYVVRRHEPTVPPSDQLSLERERLGVETVALVG